jgi:tRNA (adenine37-N6)-methyltransferase
LTTLMNAGNLPTADKITFRDSGEIIMKEITLKPIGVIHTPYKDKKGMPIQGRFEKEVTGQIEIFPEYQEGLKGVEGFSHLILIYHFDRAKEEKLTGKPFLEDNQHGIFAIRSPNRPNHIGFSTVKLEKIDGNILTFSEVDILDNTPLLDIKPYISHFDSRKNVRNGWIDQHFQKGRVPERTKLK